MTYIIEARLYRDEGYRDKLPTMIGPFDSGDAAQKWVDKQLPLWGTWQVHSLHNPKEEA